MTLSKNAIDMIVDDYQAVRAALGAVVSTPESVAALVLAAHAAQLHEAMTAVGADVDKAARMLDAIDDRLNDMGRRER